MTVRRWAGWAWAIPLAVGLVLAFWSIGFALPYLFRPDEDVLVGRAVRMAAEHTGDPLFFYYPPFAFQVFAAAEWVAGQLGGNNLVGAAGPDPTIAILTARATSAGAFLLITAFTALTARREFGAAAGLLAGLVIAVAPLTVREAHFATTDSIEVALVAATIWAGLRARSAVGFAAAGALAGLGAATKYYYGGFAVVVPLAAALMSDRRLRNLALVCGAALPALAAPFAATLHNPMDWVNGLRYDSTRVAANYGLHIGWIYHPTVSLPYGLGLGAYALCLAGIVAAAARRTRADIALAAYVGVYFLVVGASHQVFFRYMEPIYPALAIWAGGLVAHVPRRLPSWSWAVLLVLLLPGLYASVMDDRLLAAVDTRTQAARWLLANAAPGSSVWNDNFWGEPLYDQSRILARMTDPVYHQPDPLAGSFLPGLYTDRFEIDRGPRDYTIVESGPPWQAPVPSPSGDVVAIFPAYSGTEPEGAVYDPLDAYWLPFWGFGSIDHPGPSLVIVKGSQ